MSQRNNAEEQQYQMSYVYYVVPKDSRSHCGLDNSLLPHMLYMSDIRELKEKEQFPSLGGCKADR